MRTLGRRQQQELPVFRGDALVRQRRLCLVASQSQVTVAASHALLGCLRWRGSAERLSSNRTRWEPSRYIMLLFPNAEPTKGISGRSDTARPSQAFPCRGAVEIRENFFMIISFLACVKLCATGLSPFYITTTACAPAPALFVRACDTAILPQVQRPYTIVLTGQ